MAAYELRIHKLIVSSIPKAAQTEISQRLCLLSRIVSPTVSENLQEKASLIFAQEYSSTQKWTQKPQKERQPATDFGECANRSQLPRRRTKTKLRAEQELVGEDHGGRRGNLGLQIILVLRTLRLLFGRLTSFKLAF